MTTGRSEFKVKINKRDIADVLENSRQLRITDLDFLRSADYDTVHAAYILLAFQDFLKARRVDPDFEVVLSE